MGRFFYIALSIIIVIDVFGHFFPEYFSRNITAFLPIPLLIINYFDKVKTPNIIYTFSFVFTYLGITLYNLNGEVNFTFALISYSIGILIYISVITKRILHKRNYVLYFFWFVVLILGFPVYKLHSIINTNRLIVMFLYASCILAFFYSALILSRDTRESKLALLSSICFIISTFSTASLMFINKKIIIFRILAVLFFWLSHSLMSIYVITTSKTKQ